MMRYFTATIGAILMFVACTIFGVVLTAFPIFQGAVKLPLGLLNLTIRNPTWLAGIILGILAAVHSFRSTLKRAEAQQHK